MINSIPNSMKQFVNILFLLPDPPFVGFTAWSSISTTFYSGDIILFNNVLFNYSSAYDSDTSVFTCPLSGIYSVNVRMEENSDEGFIVDVMQDCNDLFRVHAHDDTIDHGASSASAMVGCVTGQIIYVRTASADVEIGFEQRNIFSVYLIQTMPDDKVQSGRLF